MMTKILISLFLLAPQFAVAGDDDPFGEQFVRTYEEIYRLFRSLSTTHPSLLTEQVLARTPGNRDLSVFTLGKQDATKKVLLICNHHGDETWVAQLCVDFTKFLVWSYDQGDPQIRSILDRSAFAIIPLGNPDGYARGSRYTLSDVNLNRNFPHKWGHEEPGSVNDKKGPRPLSEIESKALHDYQLALKGQWMVILNYHLSYPDSDATNHVLLPWAFTKKFGMTADERAAYSKFLPRPEDHSSVIVDTVSRIFFPCGGTHTDWSQAVLQVPALTMELGHGYALPTRDRYRRVHLKENLELFRIFLRGIHEELQI